jgi:S1-C subfamily serine protease
VGQRIRARVWESMKLHLLGAWHAFAVGPQNQTSEWVFFCFIVRCNSCRESRTSTQLEKLLDICRNATTANGIMNEGPNLPVEHHTLSESTVKTNSGRGIPGIVVFCLLLILAAFSYHSWSKAKALHEAALLELKTQVHELSAEVAQLQQQQAIPAVVMDRYRNSIGYINGVYHVGFGTRQPEIRVRFSGTGFVVGKGLVATNRHVAEPWYGDADAKSLIDQGAAAALETLAIFFPGSARSVKLMRGPVSTTSDLAVLRMEDSDTARGLAILPLATSIGPTGQPIAVMGYPLGVAGMVAKSPVGVYERLALRHDDMKTASKLAAMFLIRPSTTYGHLSDVIGDTIIYDAASAHGGSGGPVLNTKGEVIGVNFAYMDGFSGSTMGISVESLRPLVEQVRGISSQASGTHSAPPSEPAD